MFATTQREPMPMNSGRKFHRYVRPVSSLLNLVTIINLFKIERVLIGKIDDDETTFIFTDDIETKPIADLVSAIILNSDGQDSLYQKLTTVIKGQRLYVTVFITEEAKHKTNTLLLAIGPADDKITYVSVTESHLLNSANSIREV